MITESDVFAFISANANPTVSLNRVKEHYGEGFAVVKFHLGALFRKKMIFRQDSANVLYWTEQTAAQVERAGVKASPIVQPVIEPNLATTNHLAPNSTLPHPLATPNEEFVERRSVKRDPPPPAPPQTEEQRIAAAIQREANRPSPNHQAPMGRMRSNSVSGRMALVFWRAKEAISLETARIMFRKNEPILDITFKQYLANLVTQGHIVRENRYPENLYRWSGKFRYPYGEYLPQDDPNPPKVETYDSEKVEVNLEPGVYIEKAGEEGGPSTIQPVVSGISVKPNDKLFAIEGSKLTGLGLSSGTMKGNVVISADNEAPFDAQLGSNGQLTMKFGVCEITLSKERTEILMAMLGPHYNPSKHILLDHPVVSQENANAA